jgi:hypothetical protein
MSRGQPEPEPEPFSADMVAKVAEREEDRVIDHKIDVSRGRLAAGDVDPTVGSEPAPKHGLQASTHLLCSAARGRSSRPVAS